MRSIMRLTSRRQAQIAITLLDAAVFAVAFWLAIVIRYGEFTPPPQTRWCLYAAPVVGVLCLLPFRFYREVIRYVGANAVYRCSMGVTLTTLVLLSASFLRSDSPSISRLAFFPFWMGSILGLVGVRLIGRFLFREFMLGGNSESQKHVLIYGAGQAGVGLASMLAEDNSVAIECFIDDDRRLTGRDVRGVEVFHPDQLDELVERRSVDTVMLALPSASRQRRREVIDILRGRGIEILTVPDLQELDSGQAKFTDLRPIDIQDLLGRESVTPQQPLLVAKIRGRVVMVTGAGGSIGTELCRQIIELGPARLILIDNCEFNLFRIDAKLAESNPLGVAVVPILGTVCDGLLMQETMERYDVQTVYHAAAYKHVPIVERNPVVGVQNNVIGTLRLAEAAVRSGVQDFVAISTDKAVRPTGVMGASKRLAELILQGLQNQSSEREKTRFCMVRFGNVLGSSGSAVPKFSEQIRTGGPLTVTHPEVTRYFMTVHEAANLVIQAGALTKGGDVFVLDMGEPVKILDLATRMIDLAGVSVRSEAMPGGQIEIVFTGLQPGEKLYEELLIDGDLEGTTHPKILRSAEAYIPWQDLGKILQRLEAAIDRRDTPTVVQILQETVSGYRGPTEPSRVTDAT